MNNPETFSRIENHFDRHLVDNFINEKLTVIYTTPNRATNFFDITKLIFIKLLNVFMAGERRSM